MIKTELTLTIKSSNLRKLNEIIKFINAMDDTTIEVQPTHRTAIPQEAIKAQSNSKTCPKCGKPLSKKEGKFGPFWGCSGFKEGCRYIESIPKS